MSKSRQEHIDRHKKLHRMLDELSADFITETGRLPSKTTLMEFMQWSHEQTENPSDKNGRFAQS